MCVTPGTPMRMTATLVTVTATERLMPGATMVSVAWLVPGGSRVGSTEMVMVAERWHGEEGAQERSGPAATPATGLATSQGADGTAIQVKMPVPGLLIVRLALPAPVSGE